MTNVKFKAMFKWVYFIIINTFIIISPVAASFTSDTTFVVVSCEQNNAGGSFTATYRITPNMTRHNKSTPPDKTLVLISDLLHITVQKKNIQYTKNIFQAFLFAQYSIIKYCIVF